MRSRGFLIAGLLVAFLVAGVASYYASSYPDGLVHVAEQAGFLDSAEDSPTSDSPFAGYSTEGVQDARVGGGLAGIVGALLTLLLAGGLFWAVRRRDPDPADLDRAPVDSEV